MEALTRSNHQSSIDCVCGFDFFMFLIISNVFFFSVPTTPAPLSFLPPTSSSLLAPEPVQPGDPSGDVLWRIKVSILHAPVGSHCKAASLQDPFESHGPACFNVSAQNGIIWKLL